MLPRRFVFLLNGNARSGKDSVATAAAGFATRAGFTCQHFSSIDPVRELLAPVSDFKHKTQDDRDLLAAVGFAVEKHSRWRTEKTLEFIRRAMSSRQDTVVFVHMREVEMIEHLRDLVYLALPDVEFITVFVERAAAARITSNAADANVDQMPYDLTINNNGTLEQLPMVVFEAFRTVLPGLDSFSPADSAINCRTEPA